MNDDFITKDLLISMAWLAAFLLVPMNLIIFFIVYANYVSNTLNGFDGAVSSIILVFDVAYLYAVSETIKIPNTKQGE